MLVKIPLTYWCDSGNDRGKNLQHMQVKLNICSEEDPLWASDIWFPRVSLLTHLPMQVDIWFENKTQEQVRALLSCMLNWHSGIGCCWWWWIKVQRKQLLGHKWLHSSSRKETVQKSIEERASMLVSDSLLPRMPRKTFASQRRSPVQGTGLWACWHHKPTAMKEQKWKTIGTNLFCHQMIPECRWS